MKTSLSLSLSLPWLWRVSVQDTFYTHHVEARIKDVFPSLSLSLSLSLSPLQSLKQLDEEIREMIVIKREILM